MGENDQGNQDTDQKGTASDAKAESTSKQTPQTFTAEEHQKELSDALTKQGREHKLELDAVSTERDGFKTQISNMETTLAEIQEERDSLKSQIDNLTKDDPDKFNLVNRDNELRKSEKKVKDDLKTLKESQDENTELLELGKTARREAAVISIALDYEDGDMNKLSKLAEKYGWSTEEEIRKAADTLWTRKSSNNGDADDEEKKKAGLHPFSGKTEGGKEDLSEADPDAKIRAGLEDYKKKKKS